ncbi:bifunctional UDP-sugar hydrolase/5'-nucleotidase [Draconibacterium sp. IB214405]|uniref:bifunctional metallophosphatase/5'-nucleotidase n=1 Tax=Draconibacterium sp. IB214405 TaxID=3097352 RepID=UPI002A0DC5CA|nr:bifunctional UDP-sugar hydrolase/5'-nucleotidase [Draconibacterium sp. IB214405]MDX8339962.1 bifunctional UDP-sugar hydrolase/5'-nucleotidase [Draconibacterium sp. IB214405]
MKTVHTILLFLLLIFIGCSKSEPTPESQVENLTIFFVNDSHGQIDNFSKVKYIIDQEKQNNSVIVVSSGDMFSGNPVVDNAEPKGWPMINLMNEVGFDVMALGNHDFDYGPEILKDRIEQSDFTWICANATAKSGEHAQPLDYKTIAIDNLKITFLGLLETFGSAHETIPSSHPWRVQNYDFDVALNIAGNYSNLKEQEDADLLIALTHLGATLDNLLAANNPFFDVIIGGHSHSMLNTVSNGIPVYQAGSYLHFLGKIELTIKDRELQNSGFTLIDLDEFEEKDEQIQALIDEYNDWPELYKEIGYSSANHSKLATGCFYTDAIKTYLNADVSFQNTGGVRSVLYEGPITKREIYEISPFNNGTVIYEMSVADIKKFLAESGAGFYYSGILIDEIDQDVVLFDESGKYLDNDKILRVGINDYIPVVHSPYFPENGEVQELTAAETIIKYLENTTGEINYSGCSRYFHY